MQKLWLLFIMVSLYIMSIACEKSNQIMYKDGMQLYLPLEIGNSWKYEARYSEYATWMHYITEGEESWTITSLNKKTLQGRLESNFRGHQLKINKKDGANDTLSVIEINLKSEYAFLINQNNSFTVIVPDSSEKTIVFDYFAGMTAEEQLFVYYPVDSSATIEQNYSVNDGRCFRRYKIERDVGIRYFYGVDDYIWGPASVSYDIIEHNVKH